MNCDKFGAEHKLREGKVDYQCFISSCEAVEAIMKACNTTTAMESENYYPNPLP
jgi:hypothetical protein